jgi:NAD(P)-dependent dehydrogenase (short-subunit alcohol dehydrogenase family)
VKNQLDYSGRRVVVTGAASGMGEATARLVSELGAEVWALDVNDVTVPVKEFVRTDLRDPAAIDAAAEQIGGPVHAVFNCAGLPGAPFSNLDTMLVNFLGARQLTEALLPRMPQGSAVSSVASVAGMGYLMNMANVQQLLATQDFASGRAWCEEHPEIANGYPFSKECIIVYSLMRAKQLAERGVRINSISPGITETPMLPHFYDQVGKEWMDANFRGFLGRNAGPEEQAWPLAFLNSDAASFISGVNIFVDAGYTGALFTGQVAPPQMPSSS